MLDTESMQGDSVTDRTRIQKAADVGSCVSSDGQVCTMHYLRLTLQNDLATETPASLFAAQNAHGTLFYLPELSALPTLDEYAAGQRYMKYHVLLITSLDGGDCTTVFDILGTVESEQLGVVESKHFDEVKAEFSQHFLSASGLGSAVFGEVVNGLQELLKPWYAEQSETINLESKSLETDTIVYDAQTTGLEWLEESFSLPPSAELSSSTTSAQDAAFLNSFVSPEVEDESESEERIESTASLITEENDASISCEQQLPAVDPAPGFPLLEKKSSSNGVRTAEYEDKLNGLISHVSELSGMQSRLYDYAAAQEDGLIQSMADELGRVYSVLRDSALELRMTSLEPPLDALREWLEDNARLAGRDLAFSIQHADVQVDAAIADAVSDALSVYLSSVLGLLFTQLQKVTGSVAVEYAGRDVLLSITHPQVSSQHDGSKYSLSDALVQLQSDVTALHGAMNVNDEEHENIRITFSFPVTHAMVEGLVVVCGDEQYIVPVNQVAECIECSPRMGVEAKDNRVSIGGETVPYLRLREYVDILGKGEHEQCILIQSLSGKFGLIVDGIVGEIQAAVKPVGIFYSHIDMVSGVSIKTDGIPALVLNLQHLQSVADCLIID
ncbi:hypothetical protein SP90_03095 [Halodesulfovibrio spirochaetisodalis]|uniref:histidine kinase n=2 Tax=Halodesulfovibrio spirochaetisodalis TaxID=1560234 RepID=A0A1B7XJF5_9BACT|nr:hypothetical protein SP90_03095 [Halodesulfovibrio spirochaetisodalis]